MENPPEIFDEMLNVRMYGEDVMSRARVLGFLKEWTKLNLTAHLDV
jgi:hypothetical protein